MTSSCHEILLLTVTLLYLVIVNTIAKIDVMSSTTYHEASTVLSYLWVTYLLSISKQSNHLALNPINGLTFSDTENKYYKQWEKIKIQPHSLGCKNTCRHLDCHPKGKQKKEKKTTKKQRKTKLCSARAQAFLPC